MMENAGTWQKRQPSSLVWKERLGFLHGASKSFLHLTSRGEAELEAVLWLPQPLPDSRETSR